MPCRSLPAFRRNILPPSSGLRKPTVQEGNKHRAERSDCCFFLDDLLFNLEDGGSELFRNFGELLPEHTASHT
jgi:hypothetical protein